jgi:membrane dipeptidase
LSTAWLAFLNAILPLSDLIAENTDIWQTHRRGRATSTIAAKGGRAMNKRAVDQGGKAGLNRRAFLRAGSALTVAGSLPAPFGWSLPAMAADDAPEIVMDGHVHIVNRIYWEGIDPWQPAKQGWDYARARAAGINCIIDNIGAYGYWNYDYSPKQALRLIDTLLKFADTHSDKMAIALSPADARRIVGSGRMAVFIGCESGFDHEGDPNVLDAMYRLGLRSVQFATQTGFNAFADSALAKAQGGQDPNHYGGINDRGRKLVDQMNQLGILIDIAHGTEATQRQLIEASRAPVVASHETVKAVSGAGLTDELLKSIAAKGGLVGIHGAASVVGKRYRQWMADNPEGAANASKAVFDMLGYQPSFARSPGDHGEFIERMDREFRERWMALTEWKEAPSALPFLPTVDDWIAHVDYVIKLVGPDHVAIGLDMVAGRSSVPADPNGYPELIAALKRLTTPENVRKILGENWMRVLGQAKAA